MYILEERNQKIIDAVVRKAEKVCPGSLALIGVYGSFMTGDIHEKSDLDLLVLINDDRGFQLGCTFIQDDLQVGHDIYCTTWENLESDAGYPHPNISKLMDARVVYCADEAYRKRLEELRERVQSKLARPLSNEEFDAAEAALHQAKRCYADAMLAEELALVRMQAGGVLYYLENAVAMLNKAVFRYGVKRAYEELDGMAVKPDGLCDMIEAVVSAENTDILKRALTALMQETARVFEREKAPFSAEKRPVTADAVKGTYEEMFSNWRNKMRVAAAQENRHLAFMSLVSAQAMLNGIAGETEIGEYAVFDGYDSADLEKTADAFDTLLAAYLQEYRRAATEVRRYADIDAFVKAYLE